MESRAREGLRSGASLFKELRSSLRGAAGLPGFRDAQSQDALPNARILGSIRTRGSGAQRRECGGRSCRADLPFSLRCPRSPAGRFRAAGGPTGLFLRGITFLLRIGRWRPAVRQADGSQSRAGASFCGSFSRVVVFCRIVFPGRRCTLTAIPVPFRREEKFRCQISPSSLSLPRWTGCLTRRCARY